jgi:hypothetical protein
MDESRKRLNELPIVIPKPLSNGWAINFPYISFFSTHSSLFGLVRPSHGVLSIASPNKKVKRYILNTKNL